MNGQPASKQYFPMGETLFQQQRRRGEVKCVNERAQQKRKYSGNERCIKHSSCKGKGVNCPPCEAIIVAEKDTFFPIMLQKEHKSTYGRKHWEWAKKPDTLPTATGITFCASAKKKN